MVPLGGGGGCVCVSPGGRLSHTHSLPMQDHRVQLGTMAEFLLNNLTTDPKFDFLNTIKSSAMSDEKDDNDYISINSPYELSNITCNYKSETDFIQQFRNSPQPSILSINIQSLSSKFNEFSSLINSLLTNNCAPDVICMQELWRIPDSEIFNLAGYHPLIFKSRSNNVQGGGVGIYVSLDHTFSSVE